MRRTWGGLGGLSFFLAFLERLLFVWYDTRRSVHSQLSLCQLPALYLLCEEKNSRGGNKDTLPLSFRNPCLWRGFFLAYVGRLTLASGGYALMRLRVALLLVGAISVMGDVR